MFLNFYKVIESTFVQQENKSKTDSQIKPHAGTPTKPHFYLIFLTKQPQ